MKRILIVGSGGSGKSTLARQLGAILGIEVIHLDAIYWKPGWVKTPDGEWQNIVEGLLQRESWIMDGNYGATLDMRLPTADAVIFLDLPRTLCIWRVVRRRLQYIGRSRPDMAPRCPEKLGWEFLTWIWTYPQARRPSVLERIARYSDGRRVIILRKSAEVRRFLEQAERERQTLPRANEPGASPPR